MPITTIVFDFGGVLVKDKTKTLEKTYRFDSLSKAKQQKYIRTFHASEVGKAPTTNLLRAIKEVLIPDMTLKEIENYIVTTELLPPWKLLLKLQKRYRIIIFSNNQKTWPRKIGNYLGVNFSLAPFINSATVGIRKPHINFYKYLIKEFRLVPAETAFIDDRLKNIKPAQQLGIHAFRYQNDIRALKAYLKKLGIQGL